MVLHKVSAQRAAALLTSALSLATGLQHAPEPNLDRKRARTARQGKEPFVRLQVKEGKVAFHRWPAKEKLLVNYRGGALSLIARFHIDLMRWQKIIRAFRVGMRFVCQNGVGYGGALAVEPQVD